MPASSSTPASYHLLKQPADAQPLLRQGSVGCNPDPRADHHLRIACKLAKHTLSFTTQQSTEIEILSTTSAAGVATMMSAAAAHDAKGIPRRPRFDPVEKDAAKDKGKPAEESAKKEYASQSPHLLTKLLLHSRMRNTRPRRRRRPPRAPRKHRRTRRRRTTRRIPAAVVAAEEAATAEVANAEETPAAAEAPAQVRPLLPQSPLLRLLLKVRLDQPPTIKESIPTPLENPASQSASKAPAKPTR
ncbi:hypothetical protein F5878DRAFT_669028 [Lentinula raphanica]|uniref:Uncharacterized protein n=1 Tax=Lentinula raphanica TaxID=153919 RepID=A0AA38PF58_9AGAR|nr:hypothetical protein F5878DRAFT_669028 [Lentinula raphanica]